MAVKATSPNHWTAREFPGPPFRECVGLERGLVEDVRWLLFQTSGLLTASEPALPRSCLTPRGVRCGDGAVCWESGPPTPSDVRSWGGVSSAPRTAQGGSLPGSSAVRADLDGRRSPTAR